MSVRLIRRVVFCTLVGLAAVTPACGRSDSSVAPPPSAPTPISQTAVPPPPADLRVRATDATQRTATIEWNPSAGAERYIVEHAPLVDSTSLVNSMTAGPETAIVLRDLPGALLAVRVRGSNSAGVGPPSTQVLLQLPIFNDVVEALFFGTGPYGTSTSAAALSADFFSSGTKQAHGGGTMLGWRTGAIKLRVESTLTAPQFDNLRRVLGQITEITSSELSFDIVERSPTIVAEYWRGEVRVLVRDEIGPVCQNTAPNVLGCALQFLQANGEIAAALVFVKPHVGPDVVGHEIGHAVLGLHHVFGITQPGLPLMTPSLGWTDIGLTSLEMDAVRAVYRAGLRPGATRSDFQSRGMIGKP